MSVVASSTAFSYSHWNAFVNDESKIVVGCKEQLNDQTNQDVTKFIFFNNFSIGILFNRMIHDVLFLQVNLLVLQIYQKVHKNLFKHQHLLM